jgi:Na+-transporting NADH:ubiquinone oxidoreductase subunit A
VTQLSEGTVFLCCAAGAEIPGGDVPGVTAETFSGPHPAGCPGTHIHFLDPVSASKTVWFIGYQDVIAFGHLMRTGRIDVDRVVSLAGPAVKEPRLVRTRLGACIDSLLTDQLHEGENRTVSGSVLSGRLSSPPLNFLGRYHQQVSVLAEGRKREFMGWALPGLNKFSATRSFASFWMGGNKRSLALDTSTGGSKRAMVPIGVYEKVMPLDILPTQLLRAIIVGDTEEAQALGCLELDEEDIALCTFVCPSKYDYGPILRETLTTIELEG